MRIINLIPDQKQINVSITDDKTEVLITQHDGVLISISVENIRAFSDNLSTFVDSLEV
jgi:hypothetical protein